MLRRFMRTSILSLSRAGWARRLVTRWGFAWRVASRFVAGQTLAEAIEVIQGLNARGMTATLDYLGESTTTAEEAIAAAQEVIRALEGIHAAGARANVSLKLSQFGLVLDESLCRLNLRDILSKARSFGNYVRIDMEDSPLTDRTIAMWDWARSQGFENVGIVIQSYLYRSEKDVCHILERGGRVRLCKGAYDEPTSVAFPKKVDTDANYDHLATLLMEGAVKAGKPPVSADGRVPPIPALATHDAARVRFAQEEMRRLDLPKGTVEFQMLYGIRRDLQDRLAAQGHAVRIYVPYGTHWYPYFMRRLAERPANVWFFLSNFFRK
jgi:proline dehydrogenase